MVVGRVFGVGVEKVVVMVVVVVVEIVVIVVVGVGVMGVGVVVVGVVVVGCVGLFFCLLLWGGCLFGWVGVFGLFFYSEGLN